MPCRRYPPNERGHSESRKAPSSRLLEAETKKESREEGGRQAQDREEECKRTEGKRERQKQCSCGKGRQAYGVSVLGSGVP